MPQRAPDTGTAINNVSIVLLGEVNRHRILLAGDIEEQIDPTLLARGLPTVDLLKVAHHGSRTSSTEPFLEATRPGVAVISAGRGNPYGHPAPATVARLEGIGAEVRRTDVNGTVTVDLGVGHLRVRSSGARASNAAPSSARTAGLRPGPGVPASWLCAIPLPSLGIVALPAPTSPEIAPPPIAGLGPASRAASALLADSSPRLRYDAGRDPRLPDRRRTGVPAAVLTEERRPLRVARGVAPTRA